MVVPSLLNLEHSSTVIPWRWTFKVAETFCLRRPLTCSISLANIVSVPFERACTLRRRARNDWKENLNKILSHSTDKARSLLECFQSEISMDFLSLFFFFFIDKGSFYCDWTFLSTAFQLKAYWKFIFIFQTASMFYGIINTIFFLVCCFCSFPFLLLRYYRIRLDIFLCFFFWTLWAFLVFIQFRVSFKFSVLFCSIKKCLGRRNIRRLFYLILPFSIKRPFNVSHKTVVLIAWTFIDLIEFLNIS